MNENHDAGLTSTEIANLWSQYVNDSMAICVLKHFLKHVNDKEIKEILKTALQTAQGHLVNIKDFLNKEQYPIPKGFTEEDVFLDAPRLFSDKFMLIYMHIMTIHGLTGYAGAVSTSIRSDQLEYFIKCNTETLQLHKKSVEILVKKGIINRPPNINSPERVEFVEKQSYLTGWFGDRRPLNAMEVSGIFLNMQKNVVKICLEIAFAQVTTSKELREYYQRGEQLCDKHFDKFGIILSESDLPSPPKFDTEITVSTSPPFSDKLMLFHIVSLLSTATGYYGAAFALSQRRDISTKTAMLIAEMAKYAEDGVNIMIKRGWMEKPPTFPDRNKLASQK